MKKEFRLADVLTVVTGRLVSGHPEFHYNLLIFMTGRAPGLKQGPLGRANDKCKEALLKQFPKLGNLRIEEALAELDKMMDAGKKNGESLEMIRDNWLEKVGRGEFGVRLPKTFNVTPISKAA